jgi:hypothetical protein
LELDWWLVVLPLLLPLLFQFELELELLRPFQLEPEFELVLCPFGFELPFQFEPELLLWPFQFEPEPELLRPFQLELPELPQPN